MNIKNVLPRQLKDFLFLFFDQSKWAVRDLSQIVNNLLLSYVILLIFQITNKLSLIKQWTEHLGAYLCAWTLQKMGLMCIFCVGFHFYFVSNMKINISKKHWSQEWGHLRLRVFALW